MQNLIILIITFILICPVSYSSNESKYSTSLSRMEREWLHKEFNNDSDDARISRLEENVFGTIHDIDINTRYNRLQKAFNVRKNRNIKTSGDYLFGTPTSIPMNVNDLLEKQNY